MIFSKSGTPSQGQKSHNQKMLTSAKNPRIQRIQKLQRSARFRRAEGVFVIEGLRLAEEAWLAGCQPELVIHTEALSPRAQQILAGWRDGGVELLPVTPQVLSVVSDTQTPQGLLAVLPIRSLPIPAQAGFLLIADELRDPGNLGTILRTALAAGVEAALLPPGTVDVFSPKVVRSAMGAHFRLPIHLSPWDEIQRLVESLSLTVYLADASGGQSLYNSDFAAPLALIIGGEAAGAGSQASKLATRRVHIPMPGKAESLNAAMAAAVLLFEVVRQRSLNGSRR